MAILSEARALSIIEGVAKRHGTNVEAVICTAWDRDSVLARQEIACRLRDELGWPQRRTAELLGCSPARVCSLIREHEISVERARRLLGVTAVVRGVDEDRLAEAEARVRELEEELDRLTGSHAAMQVAEALRLYDPRTPTDDPKAQLSLRLGITLSILMEHYPRPVTGEALVSLYDEACERLNYGTMRGATNNLIAKNVGQINQCFEGRAWPSHRKYSCD